MSGARATPPALRPPPLLLYAAVQALPVAGLWIFPVFSWPGTLCEVAAGWLAALFALAGTRRHRPAALTAWYLFAAAVFLNASGLLVLRAFVTGFTSYGPSVADLLFLSMFPCLIGGLALLIRRGHHGEARTALLDTASITTGLALLSWVFIIRPQAADATLPVWTRVALTAYPVGDLVVLALMVRLVLGGGSRNTAVRLMLGAIVCFLAADVGWVVISSIAPDLPTSAGPPLLKMCSVVGFALIGAAPLHPSVASVSETEGEAAARLTPGLLISLTLVSLVAPGVLLFEVFRRRITDGAAIAIASLVLSLLVVARMGRLLRRIQERTGQLLERTEAVRREREMRERDLATEKERLEHEVKLRTAELTQANRALERAMRLKDEFVANMSHELRTPLNAILATCEALREGVYDEVTTRQRESLSVVESSGRHLLSLISDILDLSKTEAGKMDLRWQAVDVRAVCEASLQVVASLARARGIRVHRDFDPGLASLTADELRLKQMLINLLSNAVKFTPAGGQIGLEVARDRQRGRVCFTVWDTGPGIPADEAERLFRPFVQLDAGLDRKHEGTGLGLALTYRLAELHGGSVALESEPGVGSRFSIHLPWREAEAEPPPLVRPGAAAPVVLVAEDNEQNARLMSDYLGAKGCQVVLASSGAEALDRAKVHHPDVILMDVQMPGMDGLEATRRIRQEASLQRTPIIALTALAMPGDRQRCLDAGANDYQSKPVNLERLLSGIFAQLREDAR
jgi:signal transduction histidine kinase/CheY-like chemotaxis protein